MDERRAVHEHEITNRLDTESWMECRCALPLYILRSPECHRFANGRTNCLADLELIIILESSIDEAVQSQRSAIEDDYFLS